MPTLSGIVVATGGQSEGRRAFSDVIDELSRPIDASDTTVRALAADAFRAAVRRMNTKGLWPWEIQEEDITILANTRLSTATGAVKKPLSMHLLNQAGGTEDQPVSYVPYDAFLESYTLNLSSEPAVYTIPNLFETGQIQWYPTPNANDNARFAYYRVTPIPRAETEPVEIPDYVTETYMAIAWAELMKRLPAGQRVIDPTLALTESRMAFRELSAHVNTSGDRTRIVSSRLTGI